MKQVIWSNDVVDMVKSIEEDMEDFFPGYSPEELEEIKGSDGIYDKAYDEIDMWYEDELANLKFAPFNGDVIAVGTLERWNGSFAAYKDLDAGDLGQAFRQVMGSFGGDNTFEVYYEDGSVFVSQTGHDNPTNPSLFEIRELPEDKTFDDLEEEFGNVSDHAAFAKFLMEHTSPVGYIPEKVYGFEKDEMERD